MERPGAIYGGSSSSSVTSTVERPEPSTRPTPAAGMGFMMQLQRAPMTDQEQYDAEEAENAAYRAEEERLVQEAYAEATRDPGETLMPHTEAETSTARQKSEQEIITAHELRKSEAKRKALKEKVKTLQMESGKSLLSAIGSGDPLKILLQVLKTVLGVAGLGIFAAPLFAVGTGVWLFYMWAWEPLRGQVQTELVAPAEAQSAEDDEEIRNFTTMILNAMFGPPASERPPDAPVTERTRVRDAFQELIAGVGEIFGAGFAFMRNSGIGRAALLFSLALLGWTIAASTLELGFTSVHGIMAIVEVARAWIQWMLNPTAYGLVGSMFPAPLQNLDVPPGIISVDFWRGFFQGIGEFLTQDFTAAPVSDATLYERFSAFVTGVIPSAITGFTAQYPNIFSLESSIIGQGVKAAVLTEPTYRIALGGKRLLAIALKLLRGIGSGTWTSLKAIYRLLGVTVRVLHGIYTPVDEAVLNELVPALAEFISYSPDFLMGVRDEQGFPVLPFRDEEEEETAAEELEHIQENIRDVEETQAEVEEWLELRRGVPGATLFRTPDDEYAAENDIALAKNYLEMLGELLAQLRETERNWHRVFEDEALAGTSTHAHETIQRRLNALQEDIEVALAAVAEMRTERDTAEGNAATELDAALDETHNRLDELIEEFKRQTRLLEILHVRLDRRYRRMKAFHRTRET